MYQTATAGFRAVSFCGVTPQNPGCPPAGEAPRIDERGVVPREVQVIERVGQTTRVLKLDLLYQEHYGDLVRVAFLLTGDRGLAEDLTQEALLRAWRDWDRIRVMDSASGYVRGIVVNLARSSLRRRLLELRHRMVEVARPVAPDDPSRRVDLQRALARLPLRKRACVVLRYYAELSETEVASALGISVGTVKSQTHKALELLRDYLSDGTLERRGGDPAAR
jgi:RNA polymerase sigma-70 factor (sigma-E family)